MSDDSFHSTSFSCCITCFPCLIIFFISDLLERSLIIISKYLYEPTLLTVVLDKAKFLVSLQTTNFYVFYIKIQLSLFFIE